MLRTLLLGSIALNIALIVALPLVQRKKEKIIVERERIVTVREPSTSTIVAQQPRSIAAAPKGQARRPLSEPLSDRKVDVALIQDVLCDYAKQQAAEHFNRERHNIRDFVTADESPNARAQMEKNWREELQASLGLDEKDGELADLVERAASRELEFWRSVRDDAKKDPPDWAAATDAAVLFYRDLDDIVRTTSGDDAMHKVRMAQLEKRSQILAIGTSLAERSWDEISW